MDPIWLCLHHQCSGKLPGQPKDFKPYIIYVQSGHIICESYSYVSPCVPLKTNIPTLSFSLIMLFSDRFVHFPLFLLLLPLLIKRDPCFKCRHNGYWAHVRPNPYIGSPRQCPKCHWEVISPDGMKASDSDWPSTDILDLAMDNRWCLDSLDPTMTVISNRESQVGIMTSGQSIPYLLGTGATHSVLREFCGPTTLSHIPVV